MPIRWRRISRARGSPPRTILRREAALLETGGGVKAALDLLGAAPFFVVNGDAFWLDGPRPALTRLADAFDPAAVDGCCWCIAPSRCMRDVGFGDFALDPWGVPRRRREREVVPYLYAGLQLISPGAARRHAGGRVQHEPGVGHRDGRRAVARSGA